MSQGWSVTLITVLQSGRVAEIVPFVIQQHLYLAMIGQQAINIIVSSLTSLLIYLFSLFSLTAPNVGSASIWDSSLSDTAGQLITLHAFLLDLPQQSLMTWNKHMLLHKCPKCKIIECICYIKREIQKKERGRACTSGGWRQSECSREINETEIVFYVIQLFVIIYNDVAYSDVWGNTVECLWMVTLGD